MEKIILLTTLCLSLATGAAHAQSFGGGRGTESDPVRISTRAHMEELATMVNGGATYEGYHFRLTADLTGITTIIGNTQAFFFSGIFDGDGHTIELNINTDGNFAGVFGHLSGATVKNTNVSGKIVLASSSYSYPSYSSSAGGICGYADNSTVSNCYNTGSISASSSVRVSPAYVYAGGICGYGGTVSNCHNTGSISASSSDPDPYAGGICGKDGTVSNCYNTGNISVAATAWSFSYAGGICGSGGTVSNCYNTGNISSSMTTGWSYAGGICGRGGTVSNCYNMGSISSSSSDSYSYAGGICGYIDGGSISNCYNTGNISASSSSRSYAGGICGYNSSSSNIIHNCFAANATITTINSSNAGRIAGYDDGGRNSNNHALMSMKINDLERRSMNAESKDGADGEIADFKNASWLTSVLEWDFGTVWTISGISGWPVLKGLDEHVGNISPEIPLPEIVLYPNPATDEVYIRSDRTVSKVEIYSTSGACVLSDGRFSGQVDVSRLGSGIYAVRIYTSPAPQTRLLIIRK